MPRRTKKDLADEEEERRRDFAWRRTRQAGQEGLSPDRGRTGTPYCFNKPGHHWEDGRYGQRQYRDNESVHIDPFAEPGFQEFACPFNVYPNINVDAGIVPTVFSVAHQGFDFPMTAGGEHHHGNPSAVHRDPMFDGQASSVTETNPHVDVDLTVSPSPAPQVTPLSESPVVEFKPTRAKMAFHVFIADGLTGAQKRSGVPVTYSDHLTKPAFDILINIHGRSLLELKRSLFNACDKHRTGCGTLLKDADTEGRVTLRGYIYHGGAFGKSLEPIIDSEAILDQFKAMMIKKPANEVGFSLNMSNPKVQAQTDTKVLKFNRAMQHNIPNALNDEDRAAVEMSSIEVDAKVQAQRTMLMAMYGSATIGGRECMGLVNPKDTSLAMHVSHLGFDIWAKAIVNKQVGVTLKTPPSGKEFQWLPISNARSNNHSSAINSLGALLAMTNNQAPAAAGAPRTDSPAPRPFPAFEEYLTFCSISPDDHETRDLLAKYNIIDFEMFLSSELSCSIMAGFGFAFGPRLRLHEKAPIYRDILKKKVNPSF
ncbi:hypothetical protein DFH28DRAFT_1070122 [Melampsora americana]|nr:hypothetical protein DFH28DRAFT_1070122 [Melampsora americana]